MPADPDRSLTQRAILPDPGTMSFGDHLEELRRRVIWALVPTLPVLAGAFLLGRHLLGALIEPARAQLADGGQVPRLLATAPFETFGTVMHLALVVTVLVCAPWILYQLWLFVAPGLYQHERRFVNILVPMSVVLAVVGVLFLYFVILPVVLRFFIEYSNEVGDVVVGVVEPAAGTVFARAPLLAGDPAEPGLGEVWINTALNQMRVCVAVDEGGAATVRGVELAAGAGIVQQYRVSDYMATFLGMALGFGVGFQAPVVVLVLGWVGIVTVEDFRRFRRYICAGCFVVAAILTPADPLSMLLLGIPLYGLFELGLVLLRALPVERIAPAMGEGPGAGDA